MERVEVCGSGGREAVELGRILDASAQEVYVFDADTLRFLQVSAAARRALGFSGDELRTMTPLDVVADLDEAGFRALLRALLDRPGESLVLQAAHKRKDGASYAVEIRLQFIADQERPVYLAIVSDAAARLAFEAAVKRTNRAMTALTRATQAMIHAGDWQSLLDEVCRIVVEVGGYRLAWIGWVRHDQARSVEPVAKCGIEDDYIDHAQISWAEDAARGRGPAGTAIRTRAMQVARNTATDPSFAPWREAALRHGFASVAALPLTVQDEVVGVLIIYASEPDAFDGDEVQLLEDLARNLSYGITTLRAEAQRRRAERDLKESEERYRALVELSPDAILAHRSGRIVFANAAANRIFRTAAGQSLEGRELVDLFHPDDREAAEQRILSPEPLAQVVEEQMVRLDGDLFHAEVLVAEIAYHGIEMHLLVIRDVTDRKQVQDQLIQTAKLATLGEMAAGMAHELSQPLNVIRMASEGALMLINRGRVDDAWKQKQFELIADQTRRMAEIIDHIRIFSRKDTGTVETFDACDAVRMANELFERQLSSEPIAVSSSFPDDICPVLGRPVQLEQVVMNLLANAADSIREKRRQPGFETLRGRLELVTTSSEELGLVWIAISDNGTGIPPRALDRLFEPFYTTKEVGRGTGLGLSVSFGIVASMGGRIDACNNKEGASFVITLPMARTACRVSAAPNPNQPSSQHTALAPRSGAGEHHLLVVDDEADAVHAMAAYLGALGYRVSTASNGIEAWERFSADPADVVITDLRMPKGDGRGLIEKLRKHDPLLPIIVITGHMGSTEHLFDDDEDELAIVFNKPVSLQRLAETVHQFLSGE